MLYLIKNEAISKLQLQDNITSLAIPASEYQLQVSAKQN